MYVNSLERHVPHELESHHHHPGYPEEYDIETCDKGRCGVVTPQIFGPVRPPHSRKRPEGGGEPGIKDVFVLDYPGRAAGGTLYRGGF